jgi:hypothetical protein
VEWLDKHTDTIKRIVQNGPSGSGIDNGTQIALDNSTGNKLVFTTAFHHMDEGGMYDGWTYHVITIRPSLQFGFDMKITGSNRNDIKEYLSEVYSNWLDKQV